MQAAVAGWSTDTSSVSYADVSAGVGIYNYYDSAGAHPNSQGELIVAGNLANALGVGQRIIGLTGKASTAFTHRLDTKGGGLQATDWVVSGGSSLYALWHTVGSSNVGGLGSGSITLDNGTLAANYGTQGGGKASQGNWFWGNDIRIGQGGGTITQATTGGTVRDVVLSGSISNATVDRSAETPVLTFTRENTNLSCNDASGFIIAGDNSAYTGKVVVDSGAYVRIGAASATSNAAGNQGTCTPGSWKSREPSPSPAPMPGRPPTPSPALACCKSARPTLPPPPPKR